MGVFWDFSLKASNESDAEKIKAYAKELNNVYKFDLTDEDGYGGLAFFEWGFGYGTVEPDDAKKFDEYINKVVAHFPEMSLHLFVSGDGACYQWEKVSKNGVLVYLEPWQMNIHCEGEHFKELLSNIGYIEQQGFEVSQNETGCSLPQHFTAPKRAIATDRNCMLQVRVKRQRTPHQRILHNERR